MATLTTQWSIPANEITNHGVAIVGFSPFNRTLDPVFRAGETVRGKADTVWVYATAPTTAVTGPVIGTPGACAWSNTTFIVSAGTGFLSYSPFAVGEFGWILKNTPFI